MTAWRLPALALVGATLLGLGVGARVSAKTTGKVVDTTLPKARALAPFIVMTPRTVPGGMRLTQAAVGLVPDARPARASVVTLTYAAPHGPFVVVTEEAGAAPAGRLATVDGVPYVVEAPAKGAVASNALTAYDRRTMCSFTGLVPLSWLKEMAGSLRPLR